MKSLSLPVVLAAAPFSSAVYGSEVEPSAADAASPAIPTLHTPSTIRRSGHDFMAQCNDEDFARGSFTRKLADRCEDLRRLWHREASDRGNLTAGVHEPVPDADALGFPAFT